MRSCAFDCEKVSHNKTYHANNDNQGDGYSWTFLAIALQHILYKKKNLIRYASVCTLETNGTDENGRKERVRAQWTENAAVIRLLIESKLKQVWYVSMCQIARERMWLSLQAHNICSNWTILLDKSNVEQKALLECGGWTSSIVIFAVCRYEGNEIVISP